MAGGREEEELELEIEEHPERRRLRCTTAHHTLLLLAMAALSAMAHHTLLLLTMATLSAAAAAPICEPGVNMPGGDLFAPAPPVSAADSAACGALCTKHSNCSLFTFTRAHCAPVDHPCTLAGGCCWLKAIEAQAKAPVISACSCSGYVRAPASRFKPASAPPPSPRNVLYVLVDDLRPELSPYGQQFSHTPNFERLANEGITFMNAYCQISVCSPSRMSFLTGRRPDHSGIYNFIDHFRQSDCGLNEGGVRYGGADLKVLQVPDHSGGSGQCCTWCTATAGCKAWVYDQYEQLEGGTGACHLKSAVGSKSPATGLVSGLAGTNAAPASPSWTTIPQAFKNAGYLVAGTGKRFHTEEGGDGPTPDLNGVGMPPNGDPQSWSVGLSMQDCNAVAPMLGPSGPVDATLNGTLNNPGSSEKKARQLCDKVIADDAVVKMRLLVANQATSPRAQPWFLSVGFRKPHLAWRFPRPWLDKFPAQADIPEAKHPTLDPSVPAIAHCDKSPQGSPYVAINKTLAQQQRLWYLATIAWMDSQLGRVLDELDALGQEPNTLVVLHADHGWSLGEHGSWQKFTNFEHGTRVPLMIKVPYALPGLQPSKLMGRKTSVLAELIDVFPTMLELTNVSAPAGEVLDGTSLVPVLMKPDPAVAAALKPYALSQYMRCPIMSADGGKCGKGGLDPNSGNCTWQTNASLFWRANSCLFTDRTAIPFMGYTLRTAQWRYTEWVRWRGVKPMWNETVGVELYTHKGDKGTMAEYDDFENANQAAANPQVAAQMAKQLREIVKNQTWHRPR